MSKEKRERDIKIGIIILIHKPNNRYHDTDTERHRLEFEKGYIGKKEIVT